MSYVAIIRRVSDLAPEERQDYVGLPLTYPVECREFATRGLAQAEFPDAVVLMRDEYIGFCYGITLFFDHIAEQKKAAEALLPVPAPAPVRKPWFAFLAGAFRRKEAQLV